MNKILTGTILAFTFLLAGCLRNPAPFRIESVSFDQGHVVISLNEGILVKEVSVLRTSGTLLLKRNFANRPTDNFRLNFPWKRGKRYRILVLSNEGSLSTRDVTAPLTESAPLSLAMEIPHGLSSLETYMPAGASFHATLKVRSGNPPGGAFKVTLTIPSNVRLTSIPPDAIITAGPDEKKILSTGGKMTAPEDIWFRQVGLQLPEKSPEPVIIEAMLMEKDGLLSRSVRTEIRLKSSEEIARSISIINSHLPTDERGNIDFRRIADTVILPGGPGRFILSLLGHGEPPVNPYLPYNHQTLWLQNTSPAAIALVVTSETVFPNNYKPVPFLQAPDLISGGTGRSVAFAVLPPGKTTPVVLPFFLNPREASPGRYLRNISLRLWGTDTKILQINLPLELRRPSLRAFLVTIAAIFCSLIGILFLIRKGNQWFRQVPLRLLSGAAMFASVMFVLSTIPDLIAGNLMKAIMGPFSFLISGIFTEMTVYAIGAAYLMRYPIPGALGLLIIIRTIILSLTLYSLQIVSLLLLGVEIFVLEGAVWLAGITRGKAGKRLFEKWPKNKWRATLIGGGAFVVADLLITATSFHLHIFFYRLIYADWYIILYLTVTSVLFTLIGTGLGLRIGAPLREVAG